MRRTEDLRFVTGRGCYVADFTRPGLAHAVLVRSDVARAAIVRIDATRARALPGVLAVLTAADLRAKTAIPLRLAPLPGFDRHLQPPLAATDVRYVGEPVAVVIAEDRYVAEDAAAQVVVQYDARPAVVDPHQGIVASRYTVSRGDPDAAFARADYTRVETFRCHRHTAVPIETRGLVAEWDRSAETLTVWGATKVTFFNRRALARMLGLAETAIELVEIDVGGSFGVRGEFYPEDFLIPAAAMHVGRPVKWIEDRRESLLATNHSREIECELAIAARADGTILGLRARVLADMGAYARTNGGVVPAKAAQFLPGPYRIAHVACDVQAVLTNKTPAGTYRGPGRFEANFFRERLLDLMAADLGLDPVQVRMKNLITPAELPYPLGALVPYEAPSEYDSGDYASAFDRALEASNYAILAKDNGALVDGKRHGIGIGCFVESSGAGPSETARVVVKAPDRVELYTGCASSGQGRRDVDGADRRRGAGPSARCDHGVPRNDELRRRRLRHVSQPRRRRRRAARRRWRRRSSRRSSWRSRRPAPGSMRRCWSTGTATSIAAAATTLPCSRWPRSPPSGRRTPRRRSPRSRSSRRRSSPTRTAPRSRTSRSIRRPARSTCSGSSPWKTWAAR